MLGPQLSYENRRSERTCHPKDLEPESGLPPATQVMTAMASCPQLPATGGHADKVGGEVPAPWSMGVTRAGLPVMVPQGRPTESTRAPVQA